MIDGFIYDANSGRLIAWIANGDELYSVATRRQVAIIKDGELYSLAGAPLGLTLAELNSRMTSDPDDVLAKFKALADRETALAVPSAYLGKFGRCISATRAYLFAQRPSRAASHPPTPRRPTEA
jgi:hypothetical protein